MENNEPLEPKQTVNKPIPSWLKFVLWTVGMLMVLLILFVILF